ncbi:endolytic transglycosylase MltG [bacterium]|nr:endolytic transglycosylase MltG [bacterium]
MKILLKMFALLLVIVLLGLGYGYWWFLQWQSTPLDFKEGEVITIEPGDTLGRLSSKLEASGKIVDARLLTAFATYRNKTRINVGEYPITESLTPDKLLDLLQSDKTVNYSVTLVEGKTFRDYLKKLHASPKLEKTLTDMTDAEIISELGLPIAHLEGWFYPDTYRYISNSTDKDILRRAYKKMSVVLDDSWALRQKDLPYKTPYEALIMASIVEKETGVPRERPDIAGVFIRRLRIGMRLQTDPTIIYGLGDRYEGNITRAHLRKPTPYNTYLIDGLPPTPIANPGTKAIVAALNPAEGKTLYFVAKGDGSHYFSKNLKEHNSAVRRYQLKRREDYRSSPGS